MHLRLRQNNMVFKVNSIDGQQRSHSVLTDIVPFINCLIESTPIRKQDIGAQKFTRYRFTPKEKIEVREFNAEGKRQYIKVRAYGEEFYQELFLYSHKNNFLGIMQCINNYCSSRN